jgi:hypothetical protein
MSLPVTMTARLRPPRQFIPVALVLAAAIVGSFVSHALAERYVQLDYKRRVDAAAVRVHSEIAREASLTERLRRFMIDAGRTGVTSEQFARIASRWLSPGDIPAAAWVEPIPYSAWPAYDRQIDQPVVRPDERGTLVTAGLRLYYYLPAPLVSGVSPLDYPGVDLSGDSGAADNFKRATRGDRAIGTLMTGYSTISRGLFLVAPAPNVVKGRLRPGYVVVFVPDLRLRAAADTPGLWLAAGGTEKSADEHLVRASFTEAGQQFDLVLRAGSVHSSVSTLSWMILAGGLVLACLAAALGVNEARRTGAQNELD